jgi:hypothetical protein
MIVDSLKCSLPLSGPVDHLRVIMSDVRSKVEKLEIQE